MQPQSGASTALQRRRQSQHTDIMPTMLPGTERRRHNVLEAGAPEACYAMQCQMAGNDYLPSRLARPAKMKWPSGPARQTKVTIPALRCLQACCRSRIWRMHEARNKARRAKCSHGRGVQILTCAGKYVLQHICVACMLLSLPNPPCLAVKQQCCGNQQALQAGCPHGRPQMPNGATDARRRCKSCARADSNVVTPDCTHAHPTRSYLRHAQLA